MMTGPGIYDIPAEAYHADPTPVPSLSSSIARLLLAASPLLAWLWQPADESAREPERVRRQRLERIALQHASMLTEDSLLRQTVALSAEEIVEVLGHVARLCDVEARVRIASPTRGPGRAER